jgi:hypothetical protein
MIPKNVKRFSREIMRQIKPERVNG